MRLRLWVRREGKGAMRRLALATGLSYQTVWELARDKRRAKPDTAALISAATGGEVSSDELTRPRKCRRRRLPLLAA